MTETTIIIHRGSGKLLERNELMDAASLLEVGGVRAGDTVTLTTITEGKETPRQYTAIVGGVLSNMKCVVDFEGDAPEARPLNVEFVVTRLTSEPCTVCGKDSDHKHCWTCQIVLHKDHPKVNCDACLDPVREALALAPASEVDGSCLPFEKEFVLPGTRGKTIAVRTRSFLEADRVTNEQEELFFNSPVEPDPDIVASDLLKMLMGFALVSDHNGVRMEEALPPLRDAEGNEVEGQKDDSIPNRIRFFSTMRRQRYDAYERVVAAFDTLVAEAVAVPIVDDLDEDGLMEVADHLATQDEPYVGVIHALGGKLPLAFQEGRASDKFETTKVLEDWMKAQGRPVSKFRYGQMKGAVNLAAFFRADHRAEFDEDSPLMERLAYLASLPVDLFYHYSAAASVFGERLAKAEGLVKNS